VTTSHANLGAGAVMNQLVAASTKWWKAFVLRRNESSAS
jgi:hypothetical protein